MIDDVPRRGRNCATKDHKLEHFLNESRYIYILDDRCHRELYRYTHIERIEEIGLEYQIQRQD